MTAAIKVFWWRRVVNFGDAICPDIVSYLSGRPIEYSGPQQADLIGVGSIMDAIDKTERTDPVYVWGTGAMSPTLKMTKPNLIYRAVRGPLTADTLGLNDIAMGDPGILAADIFPRRTPNGRIGIVLHHSKSPSPWLKEYVDNNPDRFEIIYSVSEDYKEIVAKIIACAHIFSSSLHGLIIADSYGIPNTWLVPRGHHDFPRFKFRDYAGGLGRNIGMPMRFEDLLDNLKTFRTSADILPYIGEVEVMKANLRKSFPPELKA